MNWMQLDVIEDKIIDLRKKNSDIPLSKDMLDFFLKIIEKKIKKGEQLIRDFENDPLFIKEILKIEAQIVNYIIIAAYTNKSEIYQLKKEISRETKFTYQDYIANIDYYAKDFKNISILAKFYYEEIDV